MKNSELIAKLQQLPQDLDVCIYDVKKNEADASEEPSEVGVYTSFSVSVAHSEEDMEQMKQDFEHLELENFIALEFEAAE